MSRRQATDDEDLETKVKACGELLLEGLSAQDPWASTYYPSKKFWPILYGDLLHKWAKTSWANNRHFSSKLKLNMENRYGEP